MKNHHFSAFILKAVSILALTAAFVTGAIAAPLQGEMCVAFEAKKESPFSCETLGEVTVKQIYEKGWRVVSLVHQSGNYRWVMVIEKQRE